ncbi:MAG: hypothetical protein C4297_01520 [Gemmataceae bacterium]
MPPTDDVQTRLIWYPQDSPSCPDAIEAIVPPYRLLYACRDPSAVLGIQHLICDGIPSLISIEALGRPAGASPYVLGACALTLGPAYKEADGCWFTVAALTPDWGTWSCRILTDTGTSLAWETEFHIGGGPIIREHFVLAPSGLQYTTSLLWTVDGFRLQLPIPARAPGADLLLSLDGPLLTVKTAQHCLRIRELTGTHRWFVEPLPWNRPHAVLWQQACLHSRQAVEYRVHIAMESLCASS